MSDLRALAHLEEQLGPKLFAALISSDNTGKVKQFCGRLIIPTKITIGGRVYEILKPVRSGAKPVNRDTIIARATKMSADLGEDDGRHILDHQDDIPEVLRDNFIIFPNWRDPYNDDNFACISCWGDEPWIQKFVWWFIVWTSSSLLLRRK